MARKEIGPLLLFNLLAILFTGGRCAVGSRKNLMEMLRSVKDIGTGLYSTTFTEVVAFSCGDVNDRFEFLHSLSRIFLVGNVLDIRQSWDRVGDFAWAADAKGQNLPGDAHHLLLVLDLDCADSEEFLDRANREMILGSPFKWLMTTRLKYTSNLESIFAGKGVYPDSEVVIWNQTSGMLVSIYWMSPKGRYMVEDRGYLENEKRLIVRDKNTASRRRRDLQGTRLKSSIVLLDPESINHLTDYKDRQIDTVSKCNYPWTLHLFDMLNATGTVGSVPTWGYPSLNGSWAGMIGMLQRDEIDFGGTSGFITKERLNIIEYIPLTTPTGIRFIFQRPPLSLVSNLFKLPFRNSVWLSIGALFILLVILQYPAMRLEWLQSTKEQLVREPYPPNLSDDLLVILGSVSQQGSWYEPRSVSSRIIMLVGLLAFLNLYAAYAANIVALLQSTTTSIKTAKDLLESPLSVGAHDNVFNRHYLITNNDPIGRAIVETRIEPRGSRKSNWLSVEDGAKRMKEGQFAFHVEPGSFYKIVQETYAEEDKCGFHEIDLVNVFEPHYIVKKRSPYAELLRVSGIWLQENGLRARVIARMYAKKPVCISSNRFLSVGLTECYGAFYTLLFGILVAFSFFVLEIINVYLRPHCKLAVSQ